MQKQPSKGVLRKRYSENMYQIYRRTPMPKYDFNNVALHLYWIVLWHGRSPVNLLHIFRISFLKTPLDGCFWTWIDTHKLPDRSYSVSDIKDYIVNCKWLEMASTNPPIHIYVSWINIILVLKIKGYKLELQRPEIMKLFGSTKH